MYTCFGTYTYVCACVMYAFVMCVCLCIHACVYLSIINMNTYQIFVLVSAHMYMCVHTYYDVCVYLCTHVCKCLNVYICVLCGCMLGIGHLCVCKYV